MKQFFIHKIGLFRALVILLKAQKTYLVQYPPSPGVGRAAQQETFEESLSIPFPDRPFGLCPPL